MKWSKPKKIGIREALLAGNRFYDPLGSIVVATQAGNPRLTELKQRRSQLSW